MGGTETGKRACCLVQRALLSYLCLKILQPFFVSGLDFLLKGQGGVLHPPPGEQVLSERRVVDQQRPKR